MVSMGQRVPTSTHEVCVPCGCEDPEHCVMALYIADVRIAYAEIERLEALLGNRR